MRFTVKVGMLWLPVNTWRQTCFAAGTLVRTDNGLKPINALGTRDRIVCIDGQEEFLADIVTVTDTKTPGSAAVKLATAHEDVIVTADHVVRRSSAGFTFAGDLQPDDELHTTRGGSPVAIKSRFTIDRIFNVLMATDSPTACYAVGTAELAVSDRL